MNIEKIKQAIEANTGNEITPELYQAVKDIEELLSLESKRLKHLVDSEYSARNIALSEDQAIQHIENAFAITENKVKIIALVRACDYFL